MNFFVLLPFVVREEPYVLFCLFNTHNDKKYFIAKIWNLSTVRNHLSCTLHISTWNQVKSTWAKWHVCTMFIHLKVVLFNACFWHATCRKVHFCEVFLVVLIIISLYLSCQLHPYDWFYLFLYVFAKLQGKLCK